MSKQIHVEKKDKPKPPTPEDTRTPSGKPLPW